MPTRKVRIKRRLMIKVQNFKKFIEIISKTGMFRCSNYRKQDQDMHMIAKNTDQNLNLKLCCSCKNITSPDKMIHFKAGIHRRQKQLQI